MDKSKDRASSIVQEKLNVKDKSVSPQSFLLFITFLIIYDFIYIYCFRMIKMSNN
jgi:hypothetical protein